MVGVAEGDVVAEVVVLVVRVDEIETDILD